ncbi:MAG: hypothetical protein H0X24_05830 [Ktedonobacterales bacterium]|nr:hypothetical protein [Ktedonobacterales bacterium]
MTAPENGTRLAEGIYDYTLDDRSFAKEIWRITRLDDAQTHLQTILSTEGQIRFGIDLLLDAGGLPTDMEARVNTPEGEVRGHYVFSAGGVQGQIARPGAAATPVQLALPANTLPLPESIAMRWLIGQAINLADENEQALTICLIPIAEEGGTPLEPRLVAARATVLGQETVELLMADVGATRVLLEWPGMPPQHAWFDARRFPVQWAWVGHAGAAGAGMSHTMSLTRYAWHEAV